MSTHVRKNRPASPSPVAPSPAASSPAAPSHSTPFPTASSRFSRSPHALPVAILFVLATLFWNRVLFSASVLLPDSLRGFAPFGNDPKAPWNILQWDALGQYFPWRAFAARELNAGHIPLWNPHQFSGAPFVANGQSAVFYPLNAPFWLMDVARAFGVSAWLHTLLASISTYFLCHYWRMSRASSLLSAIAFGFCGYLTFWVSLPTLSNSASWLPLLLLLFERAVTPHEYSCDTPDANSTRHNDPDAQNRVVIQNTASNRAWRIAVFSLALCCALLAGHAQIFFYCLIALGFRALTLPRRLRALAVLACGTVGALFLGALQLLPTLELARLGHRAAQGGASQAGWDFVRSKLALQIADLPSLFVPAWPMFRGSYNENWGYAGVVAALLALAALVMLPRHVGAQKTLASPRVFALALLLFGLLYALATPLAQAFYFHLPGIAQMGGTGRALVLWNLGVAILAGFALDGLRAHWKSQIVPMLALLLVAGELFAASWNAQPIALRSAIYPSTRVTSWLQDQTRDGSRILFITPRKWWISSEELLDSTLGERGHPPGVLPPNGATVYDLNDINGYDSLSPRAYRDYLSGQEGANGHDASIAAIANGNMVLLENPFSPALDTLNVRFVVSPTPLPSAAGREVLRDEGVAVYERVVKPIKHLDGRDFSPGWRDGKYQPQSFRLGAFLSLCALCVVSAIGAATFFGKRVL